ncbi:MAG: prohibitin family protein [Lachnospira sp.]
MLLFVVGLLLAVCLFFGCGFAGKKDKLWKVNPACFSALIGVALVVLSCVKTVPTGHTGVVTVFGQVKSYTLDAGVHFLAPWEKVICMDNRIQKITVEMSGTTSDMQDVDVTFTLNYQISKTNASEIYKTIGTEYEETVVDPQVTNTVKAVMAKYAATNLITDRSSVAAATNKELENVLAKYNIEVVDTAIENMGFSADFNASIEAKVIAEQELEKAQTEQAKLNLEVTQEAQRKVTEAKGIADANEILSNSYTSEILQKAFIDKWNGELPNVVGNSSNVLDVSSYMGE